MRMNQFPKLTALLVIFLALFQTSFAQNHTVTGKVTDPNGVGIPGVTVAVRGSSISTQTASDGTYQITAPENSALVFSSVGYNTMELSTSGRSAVDATLSTSANSLNEVVVIGYGTARRRDVTGAVTTVTSKQFNQGVIISPDQLLQNKVAGVDITSNSGQPGAATTIKIRGNTSIRASQNPLYVIDGVPLDGRSARPSVNLGNNGLGFGTTPESNPLLYINPNDIAQIDILKDASAAAIYGSRGANGVIVITTKKGSAGAAKIEVGANTSVSGYMKKYEVLTASQYRSALTKYSIPTSNDAGASVDALKEIAQHTPSQSYNVAFSGGNETGKFRASFLGSRLNGLIKKSSLDKYIGSFTGQYKFLDNRLSLDFSLIAGHYTENLSNISNTAGSQGNIISSALIWNPTQPFRNSDGTYNLNQNGVVNPLAISDAFNDVVNVNTFLGNISAGYKLTNNLEYRFLYAVNHSTGGRLVNIEGFLVGFPGLSGSGYADISSAQLTSQTFSHTLQFKTNLSSNVKLDAIAGYEYWKSIYSNTDAAGSGFNTNLNQNTRIKIPYTSYFQNATTQYPVSTFVDPQTELQSYFARVNFNLLDRYFLTGTIRADGSSKFGTNNKYGYFPSLGFKWNVNNEAFMNGNGMFSNLALRVSYGITGNQEFPAGASQEQFSLASYNNAPQSIVSNPNLKWEKTSAIDAGIDYNFKGGKIYGSIDYYRKNTTDLLFQANAIQPAPSSIYFINLPANLINSGVEFAIGTSVIDKKSVGWDINFNIAYNKNILKNFYDVNTGLPIVINTGQINGQGVSGTLGQVITNGYPINEFFLKPFNGYDANHAQQVGDKPGYAGDPNPHVVAGFSTMLRFQKLTLTVNAGGSFGYLIFNNTATSVTNVNNITSGRNIDLVAYNANEAKTDGAAASTRFLEKGDFVKLRNATLRYSIGNVGSYVKGLDVYLSGTNLFVITKFHGFDPEVNVDKSQNNYPSRSIEYIPYPTPRMVTLGVNFSL